MVGNIRVHLNNTTFAITFVLIIKTMYSNDELQVDSLLI